MESRYALRELQGAIGRDYRSLEDGRRAVFAHTLLHRRLRRSYFERSDSMSVLAASMISYACIGSNARLDPRLAYDVVSEFRANLMQSAFPYVKVERKRVLSEEEENDALFDEYDEMMKGMQGAKKDAECSDDSLE